MYVLTRRYARQMREEELVFIGMQVRPAAAAVGHIRLFVCLLALAVSRFACVSAWPCDGTAGATLLGAAPHRAAPHRQESEKKASAPDPIAKAEDNRAYRKLLQVRTSQYARCSRYSPVRRAGARSKRTVCGTTDGSARGWAAGPVP